MSQPLSAPNKGPQLIVNVSGQVAPDKLLPGARQHFDDAIAEYAEMLFVEARNIEEIEHTGSGPPEITAAHIEEAKWVMVRRRRRQSRHGAWVAVLRIIQLAMSIVIGVGASNLKETWGAISTVGAGLAAAVLFIVERELTRE